MPATMPPPPTPAPSGTATGTSVRTLPLPLPPSATEIVPAPLTPSVRGDLIALGRANTAGRWPLDGDLAAARNKHVTNRLGELRDELAGAYDWFEVDVRMRAGSPIAAHDAVGSSSLWIEDWLAVGAATERGLKFDFKERTAIRPVLELVERAGVPQQRLIFNIGILGSSGASLELLREVRRRYPNATINLSPDVLRYSVGNIRRAVAIARAIGGPIMFPLDASKLNPAIVQAFRAGGKVAVWNNPGSWRPGDIAVVTARLRSWGVDGTIDLRNG